MQPYKGLQPYTETDKDNFFGREAEKRILIDKILTHKLTFLFAASGVGKSSLLQAAVLPALKQPVRMDREPLDVIYYNDWVSNPLETLKKFIVADLQGKGQLTADYSLDLNLALPEFFHICTAFTSEPLVIILDQFEEFFNYQRFSEYYQPVIRELAAAIHDRDTETVFVISMREDFALELNAFKDYIPTFLIDNFYRLEKLTLEKTRLAVVEPVAKVGFAYEPALLETLLEDLVLREQRERGLKDVIAGEELPPLVEPPHLQMICMQLWELERDNADKLITQVVFARKGGTEGLLKTYFLDKMQQLSGKEEKLVSKAFDFLVNRHGTKMPRSLPDLAKLIRVEAGNLAGTLDKLDTGRILRRQLRYGTASPEGILWYELHHDFFSKPIYKWNEAFKTKQRIKKVSLGTGAVMVAGAISFVAWDTWVNANSYHLRLSVKSGLSDVVEVYRGEVGTYDFFGQQGFVRETVYERSDIEADKLFVEQPVIEFERLNTEVIGQLPLADRIEAYLANGDLDKALGLARCAISDNDMHLSEKVILNLVSFRSVNTFGLLGDILQTKQNNISRKKIIEVLGQSKAPKQVMLFLTAATEDKINNIRKQTADSLGQLGSEKAIEPLSALLKDQDSDVRKQAADSLCQLGSEKAIEPLIALLKDQDSDIRRQAADSLGQLGSEKVIEPLIALLKDQDSDVREQAAELLGQLGSEKAIEPLIALLKDQDSDVRWQAADSLGKLGSEKAIEPLIALLKDQNWNVRAAKSLGELGIKPAIEPLIALLKDQDSNVRRQAAESLGELDSENAIEPLIALLKDQDSDIRRQATESLGQLGTEKVIEPLIALLKDQDLSVQVQAAKSLGQLGTEKAIEPLITLLKAQNSWVRDEAKESLSQLGIKQVIKPLIASLKDQDSDTRSQIAELLGKLGSKKSIEALISLLKDQNSNVRVQALESLGKLGAKQAIEPLIALLKHQNSDVQIRATASLAQLSARKAIVSLIDLLKNQNSDVREQAIKSLEQLGSEKGIESLLKDQIFSVRMQAAVSLGQLGVKQAIEPLIALLKDQDWNVRDQAANSLGKLGIKQAIEPLIALLKDQNSGIREIAVASLKLLNNTEVFIFGRDYYINNIDSVKLSLTITLDSFIVENRSRNEKINLIEKLEENLSKKNIQRLLSLLEDNDIYIQKQTIKLLAEISSNTPKESQVKILEKLTTIAGNQQELFGTRIKALENLGKLGTKAAARNIIQIATQEQGEYRDSYVFTAYQALQDTKTPTALKFLQQELAKLTQQKQQWRNQRDQERDFVLQPGSTECKGPSQLDNDKRWQYGYWETELGYAIAQHDPANLGIEMLKHPLANVRQGAWFGIAKIGVPTIKILKKINQQRDQSTQPHFRHAAFRALDKSLITIEVYGTEADVRALKNWLPQVTDRAVRDRIEFTLTELEYRLEQE